MIGPFQVSGEVSRRSLSLAVDTSKPDSVSIKGNQLDVEKRLYLGGLPHAHTTRRINVGHLLPRQPIRAEKTLPVSVLRVSGQQQFPGLRPLRPSQRRHVGSVQTSLTPQRHFLLHQRGGGQLFQWQRVRRLQ